MRIECVWCKDVAVYGSVPVVAGICDACAELWDRPRPVPCSIQAAIAANAALNGVYLGL